MLRSFRLANHQSFRDEAELLLLPAYDKSRPVVPVAGVFGANASGKSNLLDGLRWLRTAVLDSYYMWRPGSGVPRRPFRLDPTTAARPSGFCVGITVDDVHYSYGLEVDDEQVREEWLHAYPRNRRRVIFERSNRAIRLGSTVSDYRSRGDFLAKNTRQDVAFLTVAAHNDLAEAEPVFEWFMTGLVFASDESESIDEVLIRLLSRGDRDRVVGLVQAADLGITDVGIRQHVRIPIEVAKHADPARMGEASTEQALEWRRSSDDRLVLVGEPDQLPTQQTLVFHHGRGRASLTIDDQSAGTRSWLGLVVHALQTLERGGLLVVDEVDASLHPHLTSQLIEMFRDTETNPRRAQLLFTTHDATLLDDTVLARDEIWFVEKDPDSGATTLYPLTDFHPRKNENVEGRYLAGGYGAVPVLAYTGFRDALEMGRSADRAAA